MSPYTKIQGFKYLHQTRFIREETLWDVIKTTVMESGAVTTAHRSTTKAITCPACGQMNILKSRLYYWLLSKEKSTRCRNCGRPIQLRHK